MFRIFLDIWNRISFLNTETASTSHLYNSVWSVILISSVVSIFYTTIGGLKAVVWSDAFLCFCMLGGMFAVGIQGIISAGGVSEAWNVVEEGKRLRIFDWRIDPTIRLTFWNLVIGGAVDQCGTYSFNQASLQRYGNVGSLRKAQLTVFLTAFGNLFMIGLPVIAGLAIYAYYASQSCDPISGHNLDSNQLVPHFVMETLNYPGVPGMFVASIAAGALSSVSSALNAAAATTYDDLIKPYCPSIKPHRATMISKGLVVLYGCIATGLCFVVMQFGGTVYQLSYAVMGLITIPTYGMFYSGLLCPWMNGKGLIAGGLCGSLFVFFICVGQYSMETFSRLILPLSTDQCDAGGGDALFNMTSPFPIVDFTNVTFNSSSSVEIIDTEGTREGLEWLFSISYLWYRTIGVTIIIIIGSIVSLITGRRRLSDIEGRFLCCCFSKYAADDEDDDEYGDAMETMMPKLRASWTQDEFYSVHRTKPVNFANSQL